MNIQRCDTPFKVRPVATLNTDNNSYIYVVLPVEKEMVEALYNDKEKSLENKYEASGINFSTKDVHLLGETDQVDNNDLVRLNNNQTMFIPLNFNHHDLTYDIRTDGSRAMMMREVFELKDYFYYKLALIGNPKYAVVVKLVRTLYLKNLSNLKWYNDERNN